MFKSILKSAVTVAVLVISTGVAIAKNVGWESVDTFPGTEIVSSIMVKGDRGGAIILTCNAAKKNLSMTYANGKGVHYDFFTVRNYAGDFDGKNESLIVGPAVTTTLETYVFLLKAEYAFEVQPYKNGTLESWNANVKADLPMPKLNPVTEGRETFVTTPVIASYIDQLVERCPADGINKTSL
uniref:Uncharacterized protein n=1 Tax=Pantoea phage Survivor TaxID=3232176 RepID=A0AAU8KXQ4_9CAUD